MKIIPLFLTNNCLSIVDLMQVYSHFESSINSRFIALCVRVCVCGTVKANQRFNAVIKYLVVWQFVGQFI